MPKKFTEVTITITEVCIPNGPNKGKLVESQKNIYYLKKLKRCMQEITINENRDKR